MKKQLAVRHLLLVQARELAGWPADTDADRAAQRALAEAADSLEVEHDRTAGVYRIRARLGGALRHVVVSDSELRFYERGDSGAGLAEEEAGLTYGDRIASGGEASARASGPGPARPEGAAAAPAPPPAAAASTAPTAAPPPAPLAPRAANALRARQLLAALLGTASVRVPGPWVERGGLVAARDGPSAAPSAAASPPLWAAASAAGLLVGVLALADGPALLPLAENTRSMEALWRVLSGERPGVDFLWPPPSGSLLADAALMRIAGVHAWAPLVRGAAVAGLTPLVCYGLLRALGSGRAPAGVLSALPAAAALCRSGVTSPEADVTLACLLSVGLLLREEMAPGAGLSPALCGAAAGVPLLLHAGLGAAQIAYVAIAAAAGALVTPWLYGLRRCAALAAGLLAVLLAGHLAGVSPAAGAWEGPTAAARAAHAPAVARTSAALLGLLGGVSVAVSLTHWFVGTHRGTAHLLLPLWTALTALGCCRASPLEPQPAAAGLAVALALAMRSVDRFARVRRAGRIVLLGTAVGLSAVLLALSAPAFRLDCLAGTAERARRRPVAAAGLAGLVFPAPRAAALEEALDVCRGLPAGARLAVTPAEDPVFFASGRRPALRSIQWWREPGGRRAWLDEVARARPEWVLEKRTPQERCTPAAGLQAGELPGAYHVERELAYHRLWMRRSDP
jgi:hypothetical protein